MPPYTLKKTERLKSRKIIGQLFEEGQSFGVYPLRLIWLAVALPLNDVPFQMALSVPRRTFPKAVHRNLLRRRIREAYRLNKHRLYAKTNDSSLQYALMFIYTAKEPVAGAVIEGAMQKIIRRLTNKL